MKQLVLFFYSHISATATRSDHQTSPVPNTTGKVCLRQFQITTISINYQALRGTHLFYDFFHIFDAEGVAGGIAGGLSGDVAGVLAGGVAGMHTQIILFGS